MSSVSSLSYVGLSVRNLDAWRVFAEDVLAMECIRNNGCIQLRMDEQQFRFCLHEGDADDVTYVGLEVADEENLNAVERKLVDLGIDCRQADDSIIRARGVTDLREFVGPAGVSFELFYGPTMRFERPFQAPRPFNGFVTGEQGLGHIVLVVDNLQNSLKVLRDGLGFRLSDTIDLDGLEMPVYFLHCNPRHHTIGLAESRGSAKKLSHFMVQVESITDLGWALEATAKNDVELVSTLGQHTNDQMVSFYVQSPSGFPVEYGWGGIAVDDSTWTVRRHDSGSIWGHRPVKSMPSS